MSPDVAVIAWIRTDERLPTEEHRVLVVYKAGPGAGKGGSKSITLARFAGGEWRFLDPHEKSRLPERITHWMPLPRIPRGSPKPALMQRHLRPPTATPKTPQDQSSQRAPEPSLDRCVKHPTEGEL